MLRGDAVRNMVTAAGAQGQQKLADAFVIARGFLFRAQSEMLRLEVGQFTPGKASGIIFGARHVDVTLARRKNHAFPVTIRRECVCANQGRRMCAFHRLRCAVERARASRRSRVFSFSYQFFLERTRSFGVSAGVPGVGTHAFRRGAAQDMAAQGCQLWGILQAGGWKSAAFMAYMNKHELETGACAQLVADHIDSGSEGR